MKVIAIIPARYASTRFPGKPLALLGGMTMIERVYRRVSGIVDKVVVATDDERILQAVEGFGGRALMTSSLHQSGTDRAEEAYRLLAEAADIIINVQGDEPFITKEQVSSLIECFQKDKEIDIATLVKAFEVEDGIDALENPNSPKVVLSSEQRAIYFSRSVIPYLRGVEREKWLENHTFYKHIGMYAFRAKVLSQISALAPSSLEKAESLEQLRWLEAGYKIGVGITSQQTIGIDTPEDLLAAEAYLQEYVN